jgi:hypothetical protein
VIDAHAWICDYDYDSTTFLKCTVTLSVWYYFLMEYVVLNLIYNFLFKGSIVCRKGGLIKLVKKVGWIDYSAPRVEN